MNKRTNPVFKAIVGFTACIALFYCIFSAGITASGFYDYCIETVEIVEEPFFSSYIEAIPEEYILKNTVEIVDVPFFDEFNSNVEDEYETVYCESEGQCFEPAETDAESNSNCIEAEAITYDIICEEAKYEDVPYVGRLIIPSAGINVGLYYSCSQTVCDRSDSACWINPDFISGAVIADHCDQSFSTLSSISSGDTGYVVFTDNTVVKIECSCSMRGHNTGDRLTDCNNDTINDCDFAMYTCAETAYNVHICSWNII